MQNAKGVEAKVLRVSDTVLPVLISDGAPGKASVFSPYTHHVAYPIEIVSKRSRYLSKRLLTALLFPLSLVLKVGAVDKVVFVNHWMLNGAPVPDLPADAWSDVIAFISEHYPEHGIVLQDVKPAIEEGYARNLARASGLFVPTRIVNVIDPEKDLSGKTNKKIRYNRSRARQLYQETLSSRVQDTMTAAQCAQISELYQRTNIEKHSDLGPIYTDRFFELAWQCEEFVAHAWIEQGSVKIVAFNLLRKDDTWIHWSAFGIDDAAPENQLRKSSLYQRAVAADLHVSEEFGLLLDWSAGTTEFKKLRGAVPCAQYEVVFTKHLGLVRRCAWHTLAALKRLRSPRA